MKAGVLLLAPVLFILLALPSASWAHGVQIKYATQRAIEITAAYDSGSPVSGGEVAVFAPGNPSTPWLRGTCDEQGRFIFTPDPALPGQWSVQIRQAGHGNIIHFDLEEGRELSGGSGYTTPQILLMTACVIWGLVGTALYYSRRNA